jgi:hypothetical protein
MASIKLIIFKTGFTLDFSGDRDEIKFLCAKEVSLF